MDMMGGPGPTFKKNRHSALKLIKRGVNILEPAFYYIVSERSDKNWLGANFLRMVYQDTNSKICLLRCGWKENICKKFTFCTALLRMPFLKLFLLNLGK